MRHIRPIVLAVTALLCLLGTADAAAIYDPGTGRFLQRDPTGYPDGMNAYAGYHAMHGGVDPMGLKWSVDRDNTKPRVTATPGEGGDTLEDLAIEVGLDALQYRDWITFSGETIKTDGRDASTKSLFPQIKICESVEVPNTIEAYYGGDLRRLGRAWVGWEDQIEKYRSEGYYVNATLHRYYSLPRSRKLLTWLVGEEDKSPDFEFRDLIQKRSKSKELLGIYFWGHGSGNVEQGSAYSGVLKTSPQISWQAPGIDYKLAIVDVYACHCSKAAQMASKNAKSVTTFQDILIPIWPGVFWDTGDW